jgi:outer membrane lipoprotein-sorting protein
MSGCGKKEPEQVVKELDLMMNELSSYKGIGSMTMNTGPNNQVYHVEVWYQKPHYYRISLKNENKDITQIVLRNDDGVFVLTPHLDKMFRFQSDWPENSGQVYLYQSLVSSILTDKDRRFAEEKDQYIFDVAANYQNHSLARQKIWLDTEYEPKRVEVSDESAQVVVKVEFEQFEFYSKFTKEDLDMQRNMTSWKMETLPAMLEASAAKETQMAAGAHVKSDIPISVTPNPYGSIAGDWGIIQPAYVPEGVALLDMADIKLGDHAAVLLRYSGTQSFTIIQSRPSEKMVTSLPGTIMDLGNTLGVITGGQMKTMIWSNDGIEYRMTAGSGMPLTEMIKVAQSMAEQSGK